MYSAHVHVFFMQIVPLNLKSDEQELKAFNVGMDDLYSIDLTFLQCFDQPTLACLAEVRLLIHVHIHVHVHVCVYMYLYGCTCRQKYYRLYVTFVFSPSKLQGMVEGVVWVCLVSTSKLLDYPLFPQGKCTDGLLGPNVALYLYMYISVCACAL